MQREAIVADVIRLVSSISEDWDFDDEISESTRLFGDLNWQSIDMVVLAHDIQAHYRTTFPFATFFESMAVRETPGVTIGEISDFILRTLDEDKLRSTA
jgi:acyl carrier protein